MACHASGGLLATAGADKKVCVWDVDGGFCTHFFRGHQGVVTTVTFHPDPKRLILFSGSDDTSVRVWSLESKKCVAVLEKHFASVTSLSLSEDGNTLLSAGRDQVVNVWDLHTHSFQMTILVNEMVETVSVIRAATSISSCLGTHQLPSERKNNRALSSVCFLTVGELGMISVWSTDGGTCIYKQQVSDAADVLDKDAAARGFTSAIILPSDHGLLCVTGDQQFMFYRPVVSSEGAFQLNLYRRLVGYNDEILDMKFLGEEEHYLAVATNLEQIRVYETASMSCSYVLTGHTDIVICLDTCLSSSGRTLVASGSKDNNVRVWDVERRYCVGIGEGHTGAVGAVAFSRKSKNFVISGSCDRTIKVWNIDNVSGDADREIKLKSKATVAAHDKDINSLAVSPNDSLVCSGSEDRTASIWRLPDLVCTVVLKGHKRGIWSVEFSPVDQCVITSSGDKTIKIWAISDGSCLKTFEGHTSTVLRASFLTRGAQFVSCGGDGLVKLWTVKTNECIATYDQHDGKVWAVAVGKKTEMLATGGTDAIINLWHDSTAADKQEAFHKEQEATVRGQDLENAVKDADFTRAIRLAFELRRPHKLLDLFSQLCRKKGSEDSIEKALSAFGKEEVHLLLEYIREWNTKPKLCHVAQFVLSWVFKIFSPTEIMEIKGVSELLEGLIPYSQRHFNRVDRLVRSTFLLDYILVGMSVLDPESGTLSSKPEAAILPSDDNMVSASKNASDDKDSLVETEEKVSSKKRKSSKSKKAAQKKVKLALHNEDGSALSVGA